MAKGIEGIECNPKQRSASESNPGSGVRPPGRHHTDPYMSEFRDEHGRIISGYDAPKFLLSAPKNDPVLIPVTPPETLKASNPGKDTPAELKEIEELLKYHPDKYADDRDLWKIP